MSFCSLPPGPKPRQLESIKKSIIPNDHSLSELKLPVFDLKVQNKPCSGIPQKLHSLIQYSLLLVSKCSGYTDTFFK